LRAEAKARAALGRLEGHLGKDREALSNIRKSVRLFREVGDPVGEALALDAAGVMVSSVGYLGVAERVLARCMDLTRHVNQWVYSHALYDHGDILRHLGRFEDAQHGLRRAWSYARSLVTSVARQDRREV
jgi:tetratricopeptide (TPR) repeat protein